MAQAYETMSIVHPETSDEEIQSLIDSFKEVVTKSQGDCLKVERWGQRRLVYKIKGLLKGYFLIIYYFGNPKILQEIDSLLRYREQVLRYQTLKLDKKIDPESIRASEATEPEATADGESEEQIAPEDTALLEETKEEAAP
jgi:small subunit ribosomal protein S6